MPEQDGRETLNKLKTNVELSEVDLAFMNSLNDPGQTMDAINLKSAVDR